LDADRGDEKAENARSDAQTNIARQSSQEFSRKQNYPREQGNTHGHGHQARSQFRAFSFSGFASVQDQVRDDARSDQQWHGKRNDDLSISRLGFAQRADFRCDCEVGEIRLPCARILS